MPRGLQLCTEVVKRKNYHTTSLYRTRAVVVHVVVSCCISVFGNFFVNFWVVLCDSGSGVCRGSWIHAKSSGLLNLLSRLLKDFEPTDFGGKDLRGTGGLSGTPQGGLKDFEPTDFGGKDLRGTGGLSGTPQGGDVVRNSVSTRRSVPASFADIRTVQQPSSFFLAQRLSEKWREKQESRAGPKQGDGEKVILTESGASTGLFQANGGAAIGDGKGHESGPSATSKAGAGARRASADTMGVVVAEDLQGSLDGDHDVHPPPGSVPSRKEITSTSSSVVARHRALLESATREVGSTLGVLFFLTSLAAPVCAYFVDRFGRRTDTLLVAAVFLWALHARLLLRERYILYPFFRGSIRLL